MKNFVKMVEYAEKLDFNEIDFSYDSKSNRGQNLKIVLNIINILQQFPVVSNW